MIAEVTVERDRQGGRKAKEAVSKEREMPGTGSIPCARVVCGESRKQPQKTEFPALTSYRRQVGIRFRPSGNSASR
jgi:hypothetical protein